MRGAGLTLTMGEASATFGKEWSKTLPNSWSSVSRFPVFHRSFLLLRLFLRVPATVRF